MLFNQVKNKNILMTNLFTPVKKMRYRNKEIMHLFFLGNKVNLFIYHFLKTLMRIT